MHKGQQLFKQMTVKRKALCSGEKVCFSHTWLADALKVCFYNLGRRNCRWDSVIILQWNSMVISAMPGKGVENFFREGRNKAWFREVVQRCLRASSVSSVLLGGYCGLYWLRAPYGLDAIYHQWISCICRANRTSSQSPWMKLIWCSSPSKYNIPTTICGDPVQWQILCGREELEDPDLIEGDIVWLLSPSAHTNCSLEKGRTIIQRQCLQQSIKEESVIKAASVLRNSLNGLMIVGKVEIVAKDEVKILELLHYPQRNRMI